MKLFRKKEKTFLLVGIITTCAESVYGQIYEISWLFDFSFSCFSRLLAQFIMEDLAHLWSQILSTPIYITVTYMLNIFFISHIFCLSF